MIKKRNYKGKKIINIIGIMFFIFMFCLAFTKFKWDAVILSGLYGGALSLIVRDYFKKRYE